MALEDGSGMALALGGALGGGVGRWLKMQRRRWAVAAAEEHATMALASALSKPRAYCCAVVVSFSKEGKRRCIQCVGRTLEVIAMR